LPVNGDWQPQQEKTGQMRTQQQTLLWAGRILGVALALFLSLFAWDVFEVEGSFWEKVGGFLVHLTPT
jgi:hypothetical protein